jgi:putative inorganic carbon (hco3(-)) transporter
VVNNQPKNIQLSFLTGSVLFIIITAIAIYSQQYYLLGLGFAPLIIYFSIFKFEILYYFIVFVTPLSISLEWLVPGISVDLSLPSELLLALMLLILLFKAFTSGFYDKRIFSHPISIAVFIYLGWMLITTVTSSMPLVSIKYFIAKTWFIFPLYFFPVLLFRQKKTIYRYFLLYIIPFSVVILYTINKHLGYGLFDKQAAHLVMRPFYNDHTSYGAILAMYLPVLVGMLFIYKKKLLNRVVILGLLGLFLLAIVLSYTRAAWISVLGAGALMLLMLLKIKLRTILLIAGIIVTILFSFRLEIIDKLDKNKQDSSAELSEHVKSISNIATDASNLERINRWNSALKMFEEKPVFGWGPGTYMFQYAPFQMADDKTIISTNFADWGNAHSEYIGPLAEQGIPGLITILLIVFTTLQTAFKLYYKLKDKLNKQFVLISILSLTTYFIHGLLNNFLDTDKASVPFWGMVAIIVSIDLWSGEIKNPQLGGAEER